MKHDFLLAAMRRHDERQFQNLKTLNDFLETSLARETARRTAHGKEQLQSASNSGERAWIAGFLAEDLFEIERDFPRIVRYSLFVTMMSVTEACLIRLCRFAHKYFGISRAFEERGPDVIQRSVAYLVGDAKLNAFRMKKYIRFADSFRKVRNTITHADGCIKGRSDAKDVRKFASKVPTIEIDRRGHIMLLRGFVNVTAHEMGDFIAKLHQQCRKSMNDRQTARP